MENNTIEKMERQEIKRKTRGKMTEDVIECILN